MVQREERCAAVEADAVERMERLVKAEADLQEREEAVKRREAAVASAAADAAMAGADLDAREAKLRERERQLCTAPPVKVEPNEWADAVGGVGRAPSPGIVFRKQAVEATPAAHGEARAAHCCRVVVAEDACARCADRGAKSVRGVVRLLPEHAAVDEAETRPRAARLALESRAGAVLDGVHAHYSASKLVKGGLRRELSLERFWALARDFHLAPAFASYAYLMHLARDVLRGDAALSRDQFGRALAQLALEAAGKAGEPPSVAVARVLDCMETVERLAKVGLSRAVKFRHG